MQVATAMEEFPDLTMDSANHCVKYYQILIIVRMLFYHLVCFLPLVGFQSFEGFFCHMGCLLPRVGFRSADRMPTTKGTSTINGFSDIAGFSTINGLSTIDGFPTTKGAFCRWDLYHWWDFIRLEGLIVVGGFSTLMKQTKKKGINTQSLGVVIHSETART